MTSRRAFMRGALAISITPILPAIPLAKAFDAEAWDRELMAHAIEVREKTLKNSTKMAEATLDLLKEGRFVDEEEIKLAGAAFSYFDELWLAMRGLHPEGKSGEEFSEEVVTAFGPPIMRYLDPNKGRVSRFVRDRIEPHAALMETRPKTKVPARRKAFA